MVLVVKLLRLSVNSVLILAHTIQNCVRPFRTIEFFISIEFYKTKSDQYDSDDEIICLM